VVEVDVAEQQVTDVGESESALGQFAFERGDVARRAAIEEREAVVGLEQIAADDALAVEVVEVD
jgi:hypothetical protein